MARILTVCTANVCRSAGAAAILSGMLPPAVQITSAGVAAEDGHEMCAVTRQWLHGELGLGAGGHRSRALADEMIVDADLVLVASLRQRKLVLARVPRASVFTMREAAVLAERQPGADTPRPEPDATAALQHFVRDLTATRHRRRFPESTTETVTVPGDGNRRRFRRGPQATEITISPYDVPDAHVSIPNGDHTATFGTLRPAIEAVGTALLAYVGSSGDGR